MKRLVTVLLSATSLTILLGSPNPQTAVANRTLTFAERVFYQRAIEEVYWHHRIWPKERPDPKPSLDAVMSQAQLENKVEEYVRNSQALEDYWHRPLTSEELQAEIHRMAEHTGQPEVLRELFEALGNDSFVIAECVAKPVLTERLVADLSAQDKTRRFESARSKGLRSMSVGATLANVAYTLPKISERVLPKIADPADAACADNTWTDTPTAVAPLARYFHTAVWTGTQMIIWGGMTPTNFQFNTGGIYFRDFDSWVPTSTRNAPEARHFHTTVWTGNEMIVWGGYNGFALNTGGRTRGKSGQRPAPPTRQMRGTFTRQFGPAVK